RDLFYTYDAISHFRAAQIADTGALSYITWNALGRAILLSRSTEEIREWLSADFVHDGPRRSVVLIDEVDKAPRDFPNDLLNEVEEMFFRVPELKNVRIDADAKLRPIIVLTSNSEKNLPDTFLRRCVYYNIPFPDRDRLVKIVMSRIGGFANSD